MSVREHWINVRVNPEELARNWGFEIPVPI